MWLHIFTEDIIYTGRTSTLILLSIITLLHKLFKGTFLFIKCFYFLIIEYSLYKVSSENYKGRYKILFAFSRFITMFSK